MNPSSLRLALLALVGASAVAGASNLTISQQPLFLSTGVDPNIIVTLDNSNSMKWGFIPDSLGYSANNLRATRRVKSSTFNPLYYNPAVTYAVPKKVTFGNGGLTVADYPVSSGNGFDFTKVYVNGFRPGAGTVDLSKDYRVAWEYDTSRGQDTDYSRGTNYGGNTGVINYLAENPSQDFARTERTDGVQAYYYRFNARNAGCNGSIADDDCYTLVNPTSAADRQNFAIWYAFYRNRALSMQSSANLAFSQFSNTVRLTWQDLSNCTTLNSSSDCAGISYRGSNLLRTFDGQARTNFFKWLGDINFNTGTPLRSAMDRAGRFLQSSGSEGPYAKNPGVTQSPEYACRPSYQIMMTDGKWNSDTFGVGNVDGSSQTLPDGTEYSSTQAPFTDSASNTLADLAFKYWAIDAQPAITNKLSPYIRESSTNTKTQYWNPKNDPATWQHLVTYTVGFGLSSSLTNPAWGGSTYAGGYSTSMTWPTASSDSDNNVYDLWHAAINSRGEFFSADDADGLVDSLNQVVTRIAQTNSASASQSSSPLLDSSLSSNYTYVPTFSSTDWSGDLTKYLRSTTSTTRIWSAQGRLDAAYGAGNQLRRNVQLNVEGVLKPFVAGNLSADQLTSLGRNLNGTRDGYAEDRVNYLRGDRSKESKTATPSLRIRNHLLGDIIDSTPALVTTPDSPTAKMNALGSPGSYSAFQQQWAQRATRIYVGANDGMLHAFDDNGDETFAFVPSAVIPTLYKLTDPGYTSSTHQFYVDGSPVVQDVYYDSGWHTVLIGTLRGGGKALFALDITDPAAPKVLWERSASDSDLSELGLTYSKPVVARLHTGDWAVLLANGYNGANDKAVLYALDVKTGKRLAALTPEPNDGLTTPNGLAAPTVADVDGDLIADYAYAGDLHGNLWRFDLIGSDLKASATVNNLKVAFGGAPLYRARASSYSSGTAGQVQAIMAAPRLVRHPSGIGHLLLFGTGKYLEPGDATADAGKAMSLYGIWDRQTAGEVASSTPNLTTAKLQLQTLGGDTPIAYTSVTQATINTTANTLSAQPVDWYSDSNSGGKYGWYLNLPATGEMIVTKPLYLADTLLAASLVPNNDPCDSGAVTYLYAVDPYTGGGTDHLQLGTQTSYARLQMAGLLSGLSAFLYGNGVISVGGTTITTPSGSDQTLVNSGQTSSVGLKASRYRQTWRTISNQNPEP